MAYDQTRRPLWVVVSTGRRNTLSLKERWSVLRWVTNFIEVYCGREDGVMGSLEARRIAEGDRTGFRQAVIVDLFFGGSAWWDSAWPAASLQAGIDARGTRGDFQKRYGPSIGTIDRQVAWSLTLGGEPGNEPQWRL
jgi:hypothetical protein